MGRSHKSRWLGRALLVALALLAGYASPASAQLRLFKKDCGDCKVLPECLPPSKDMTTPPKEPIVDPTPQPITTAALDGATVSLQSNVGYIYSAVPRTQFVQRYDAAFDSNRPDRAEFFYAKCGCFRPAGDPGAAGPPLPEKRVDYQDITSYFEVAPWQWLSAFIEVPLRFLNPDQNANESGIADIKAGFKAALLLNNCQVLTFQMRTYIPTGDAGDGLGTNHVSLEPALLYLRRLTDRLTFEGQFGVWVPLSGSDFAGNVLFYGTGLGFNIIDNGRFWVTPISELVGWSVLSGQSSGFTGQFSAVNDTIINAKTGVRVGLSNASGLLGNSDVYVGYGRALTGEVWYKDIYRVEFRVRF